MIFTLSKEFCENQNKNGPHSQDFDYQVNKLLDFYIRFQQAPKT